MSRILPVCRSIDRKFLLPGQIRQRSLLPVQRRLLSRRNLLGLKQIPPPDPEEEPPPDPEDEPPPEAYVLSNILNVSLTKILSFDTPSGF